MRVAFSGLHELLEVVVFDLASVVCVKCSHDVRDVLIGNRMVKVVGKHSLQVYWLNMSTMIDIKHVERVKELALFASVISAFISTVPTPIDELMQEIKVEARARIVLVVLILQLFFL